MFVFFWIVQKRRMVIYIYNYIYITLYNIYHAILHRQFGSSNGKEMGRFWGDDFSWPHQGIHPQEIGFHHPQLRDKFAQEMTFLLQNVFFAPTGKMAELTMVPFLHPQKWSEIKFRNRYDLPNSYSLRFHRFHRKAARLYRFRCFACGCSSQLLDLVQTGCHFVGLDLCISATEF